MSAANSIEIQGLSKSYRLGAGEEAIQIREQLMQLLRLRAARGAREIVWALQDVSFAVPEGQVVGIVGRNGAGKSTLLKILSRITYPTSGAVKVRGRVASLLEVGTGFHEELTGRENIYLNGSILGMRRREIDRHFDAIVEFSGLSQFVDTPIKRFSTGMRLRLGFAVAAHLNPDVLIVDEVLAVGDAGFQKKCISAMEGLRSGGRTVLFVSHNMAAVEHLCSRALWIDGGHLRMDGPAKEVIKAYLASYSAESTDGQELQVEGRTGTGDVRFTSIELLSLDAAASPVVQSGDGLIIRMHYRAELATDNPKFIVRLYASLGTLIMETSTRLHGITIPSVGPGEGYIDLQLSALNLVPGRYILAFYLESDNDGRMLDGDVRVFLDIEPSAAYGTARELSSKFGIVYFPQRWTVDGDRERLSPKPAAHPNARVG